MAESRHKRRQSRHATYMLGGAALLVVFGIVQSPGEAFRASLSGLQIWWQHVFPGLLPPLVIADLLAASGLLHGLSAMFEPLTRSLFRLPGAAGWAMAFGWSAGIPAGARETARLRNTGLIRSPDTALLLFLSHQPNPFLVVVIVGAGLLHSPALGWMIAAGVWTSAILVGLIWARARSGASSGSNQAAPIGLKTLIRQSVRTAEKARRMDGRPFGKQLADSVTNAVTALMAIGGLMMMASVLLRLLQIGFPGADVWIAVPGLYEMHLGAYESARSPLFESAPAHAAALLAAALAWTGWSSLLQARAAFASASSNAPFPWAQLIAGKLLQAALALILTALLVQMKVPPSLPDWLPSGSVPWTRETFSLAGSSWNGRLLWTEMGLAGLATMAAFWLLALLAAVIRPAPGRRKRPPRA
jgi:hypothetical protein